MTTGTRADDLEVAVEEREAWKRRLTITVAGERVASVRQRERRALRKNLKLKGFRKGKVPDRIVEERFGAVIDERTVRSLIEEAFRQAIEQKNLQPVGDPSFGDVQYEPSESLTFQVEFEVMPTLRIERVGGFRLRRPAVEVSDAQVSEVIDRLRDERAVWHPIERRASEGDLVSVKIARLEDAASDTEPVSRPYRFELGKGSAIPAVEEAIRSLAPGEQGEFEVTFPEDFGDEALAGRTRRLRIELGEVKEKRLPELEDAFASDVGDFDSLAALENAVRDDLRRQGEEEAEDALRRSLIDHIVDANPFEVPLSMVDRYLERMLQAPEDADPEQLRTLRQELRPQVERQLRHQLVIDSLIEREELEATEEELEARVAELGERRGIATGEVRKRLARQGGLDDLRRRLAVEKLFDWLLSQSAVE